MTIGLYLVTLTAGIVLGWQGSLLATSRRRASSGPVAKSDHPAVGTGPELDLRDHPGPFDWRTDPVIAGCPVCHGIGRFPTFQGRLERCPCGAPAPNQAVAQ